jgi:hypothetical protein
VVAEDDGRAGLNRERAHVRWPRGGRRDRRASCKVTRSSAPRPCSRSTPPRGELPPKVDKDPEWGTSAMYTAREVEQLISAARIAKLRVSIRDGEALPLATAELRAENIGECSDPIGT